MQVRSVNPNFSGRQTLLDADFLKNASDNDLKRLAYSTAEDNNQRRNKLSKFLYAAAPVAAGINAALKNDIAVQTIGKTGFALTGTAGRLANGIKAGGLFALALGLINLVSKKNESLMQNSPRVRDFEEKNPLITTVGLIAASLGAIKAGDIALKTAAAKIPDAAANVVVDTVHRAGKQINTQGIFDTLARKASFVHPALKQAGKTVLAYAPLALLISGAVAASRNDSAKNIQAAQNFADLKILQSKVA
jgi:hypothetical protein